METENQADTGGLRARRSCMAHDDDCRKKCGTTI